MTGNMYENVAPARMQMQPRASENARSVLLA
jgi:hypothetical protein